MSRTIVHLDADAFFASVEQAADFLLELLHSGLQMRGFKVHSHSLVPPNDGGLALGQAAVALAQFFA